MKFILKIEPVLLRISTRIHNGVEDHRIMKLVERVRFNILYAALDIDKYELDHAMMHTIEDAFLTLNYRRRSQSRP
ncbi:MAG: hypothetical protein GX957_01070 [Clostridiaceae bacterium]|nr:hypothetical protein [Clostridiaceae bacterium]